MGGFTLEGPTYRISSLPDKQRCRCTGFRTNISKELEDYFVNKNEKVLKLNEIPQQMQDDMLKCHIGENFNYKVEKSVFTFEEYEAMKVPESKEISGFDWNKANIQSFF